MKTNLLWKSHFLLPMLLRACVVLHPHFITNIGHPEKLSACQESLSQATPCKFYAYGAYTLPLRVRHLSFVPHYTRLWMAVSSDDGSRIVTARSLPRHRAVIQAKSPDNRRNLYVLGLPFDLSECVACFVNASILQLLYRTELTAIFSNFGTVSHSVILATVDNSSRRRGFVVMSTHVEAKAAMDNLSQTNIRCVIVWARWPSRLTLSCSLQRVHC